MGLVPHDTPPKNLYISDVCDMFGVSTEALIAALKVILPVRVACQRKTITPDEHRQLLAVRYSCSDFATNLKLHGDIVRALVGAEEYASASLFGLHSLRTFAQLWDDTAELRATPMINNKRIALSEVYSTLDCSNVEFNRIVAKYGLQLGDIELRRTNLRSARVTRTISLESYEAIHAWFNHYAPEGWHPVYVLAATIKVDVSTIRAFLEHESVDMRIYRDAQNGRWLKHYPVNAIAPLVASTLASGRLFAIYQIARQLGRTYRWVACRIDHSKGQYCISANGRLEICYPPQEVKRLRELNCIPDAGDWLTCKAIAATVKRSQHWVAARISVQQSEQRRAAQGFVLPHYPPSEVDRLSLLSRIYPPADDWLVSSAIARVIGRSNRWVNRRINIRLSENRLTPSGRIRAHYPPSELERLKSLSDGWAQPANDWLTVTAIAASIGRDAYWVERRINQSLAELRALTIGREEIHYPPSEKDRLRAINEAIVPGGDWVTLRAICLAVGRSHDWVVRHVNNDLVEARQDSVGTVVPHYPPSECDRLRQISEAEVPAGDWLTVSQIAVALSATHYWVKRRVNNSIAETRIDSTGRRFLHYPPSELARLTTLHEARRRS